MTTGRRRRCGWFDAVIARYATRVNGITDYFLTKLDVLSSLQTVPVCVGYEIDGRRADDMPMTQTDVHDEPIYEELPGWWEDISGCRRLAELPANARAYVQRVEELTGAPVSAIGVGPGRDETITRAVWRRETSVWLRSAEAAVRPRQAAQLPVLTVRVSDGALASVGCTWALVRTKPVSESSSAAPNTTPTTLPSVRTMGPPEFPDRRPRGRCRPRGSPRRCRRCWGPGAGSGRGPSPPSG